MVCTSKARCKGCQGNRAPWGSVCRCCSCVRLLDPPTNVEGESGGQKDDWGGKPTARGIIKLWLWCWSSLKVWELSDYQLTVKHWMQSSKNSLMFKYSTFWTFHTALLIYLHNNGQKVLPLLIRTKQLIQIHSEHLWEETGMKESSTLCLNESNLQKTESVLVDVGPLTTIGLLQ